MATHIITSINQQLWRDYAERTIGTWQFQHDCWWEHEHEMTAWADWRLNHQGRPDEGTSFAKTCLRFTHKVEAQCHYLRHSRSRYVIWLDADVEQIRPIPQEQWALWLPPEGAACTYLGRSGQYPETGFVIWDREHALTQWFVDQWQQLYFSDQVWQLEQWHDAWVWNWLCESVELPRWSLTTTVERGEAFGLSSLSPYFRHLKGPRKYQ